MAVSLAGCSDEDSSTDRDKGSAAAADTNVAGRYLCFDVVLDDRDIKQNSTADELLESAKTQYEYVKSDDEKKAQADGIGRIIELNDDFSFKYNSYSVMQTMDFSGSYKLDDGKIKFSYDKYVKTLFGIQSRINAKMFDEPEVTEIKTGENDEDGYGKALERANKTGTFLKYIGPDDYYSLFGDSPAFKCTSLPAATGNCRYMSEYSVLDVFRQRKTLPAHMNYEFLEKHGDFLCGNTAGWELESSYEYGKPFTITYDPEAILDDWNFFDDDIQRENAISNIKKSYGELEKSTIEFSDGEWVWKNSGGDTLSNGTYSESEQHKGFIIVRADEKSSESAVNEYIYFDGKGIYYPYGLKL